MRQPGPEGRFERGEPAAQGARGAADLFDGVAMAVVIGAVAGPNLVPIVLGVVSLIVAASLLRGPTPKSA